LGITRGTTKAHVARAALEAIAYQSADVVRAMEQEAGVPLRALRVDGGAAVNDFLMQFQADVLDVPVERPAVTETTALGAAYLAGWAAGVWRDRDEIVSQWHVDRRFEAGMGAARGGRLLGGWRRAVERSLGWAAPCAAGARDNRRDDRCHRSVGGLSRIR